MKHALTCGLLVTVLSLWLTTSAWAGFGEGFDAYERGDYAAAIEELLPVAEQGDALSKHYDARLGQEVGTNGKYT